MNAFTSLAGGNVKLECDVDANVVVQGEGGPAIKPSTGANLMRGNSPARVPLLVLQPSPTPRSQFMATEKKTLRELLEVPEGSDDQVYSTLDLSNSLLMHSGFKRSANRLNHWLSA